MAKCLATKQCLMVFGRQTFPVLERPLHVHTVKTIS